MSYELSAIRTRYNGTLFRSKLEADWARAFDHVGVEWLFEPEGRYWGDVFYLPDFWLPRSRQWVEVKAEWSPQDCRKVGALLAHSAARPFTDDGWTPDIQLIAAGPTGIFFGYSKATAVQPIEDLADLLLDHNHDVHIANCRECGGWWFFVGTESFRCQCCGFHDGDHHLRRAFDSPWPQWPAGPSSTFPW